MKKILVVLVLVFIGNEINAQNGQGSIIEFAQFPGGPESLFQFIRSQIQYPDSAVSSNQTGTVLVEFQLDSAGRVVNETVRISQALSASHDAEAVRVVKQLPPWSPARSAVGAVSQWISLPIRFDAPE